MRDDRYAPPSHNYEPRPPKDPGIALEAVVWGVVAALFAAGLTLILMAFK